MRDLPAYLILNDSNKEDIDILRARAESLTFPLSQEDQHCIQTLSDKFDAESNCAGLAAPQIGFSKQVIVFAVPDDPNLKKWRPDLVQTMPKTIWINPTYESLGNDTHKDYEGCFSVNHVTGPVTRFKKIRYSAYTVEGTHVEGVAEGFLARIIQHEIDHLRGHCFIDHVLEHELLPIEEYRERRRKLMGS